MYPPLIAFLVTFPIPSKYPISLCFPIYAAPDPGNALIGILISLCLDSAIALFLYFYSKKPKNILTSVSNE